MDLLSWVRYLLYEFIQSSQIQLCHGFKHSPDQNLLSDQAWPNRSGHLHLQFSVLYPRADYENVLIDPAVFFWWGHLYVSPVCLYKKKCSAFSWKMSNHDNCLLLLFFFFFLQFISQKNFKKKKKKTGTCTRFVQLLLKMSTAAVFILFLFALTHVLLLWWWGGKCYEMSKCSHAVCGLDQQWLVE